MRFTPDVDPKVAKELGAEMHEDGRRMYFDISMEDYTRYKQADESEWTEVTQQDTGRKWLVTSAPCGGGCHCAAYVKPVVTV